MSKRARDYGLICGALPPGPLNAITDVPGVTVGHRTLREDDIRTGFTVVLPHPGDLFREKVRAGIEVINGFGKSAGLMQLAELGQIETPILLGNTFSVGAGTEALVGRALAGNPEIGRSTGTVNSLVLECNDGFLSDIRARRLTVADAEAALDAASGGPVEEGAVGAGTGMSAFGFKGGIGTASRLIELDRRSFTLGVLVQANFGNAGDLVLPDGRRPVPPAAGSAQPPERGSVIIVLATDLPLESRQLTRIARRCGAGLARLGAFWGHGSGDIAIAFSTAGRIAHDDEAGLVPLTVLNENRIDLPFRAAAEATQEAVLNAMLAAPETVGRDGNRRPSLADCL
ncbi:D-aminopeptidase [Bosea sp. 62]|uniref:DmpA family aminopeptidase n=1 Tax=unclassified Bosea (in: a-proteobacteria) TaxID=2653178 RepID=UPI001255210F|nr:MULTISPECIES: P1 family peptidase [unclassified Bosea (in: a-proteobacteria)]CAD5253894.1 D-aminopeptidase [Bosea sp. 7B]CAD5277314.1 D-aminopeptidase [Bosea sp. 21B]CAD5278386.1 D-aminopeptidase [Bosea sp. 46]VVT59782.1 D-aminopeptidase [Bosea sp. EC-HK365B]VXB43143.1 D-aminopeptidase [Bosea sp. 62]